MKKGQGAGLVDRRPAPFFRGVGTVKVVLTKMAELVLKTNDMFLDNTIQEV